MGLSVKTPPAAEPLEVAALRAHLRLEEVESETPLLAALIGAAREACERFTGRALVQRTLLFTLDRWPCRLAGSPAALRLPQPPLAAVVAVRFYDEADQASLWDPVAYYVDVSGEPGRVVARRGAGLPWGLTGALRAAEGIEVEYVAGYPPDETVEPIDHAGKLPRSLTEGMKRLAAHLYENRGDDPALAMSASGAELLWRPYKVFRL